MMRFTSTLALAASLTLLSLGAQAAAPSNWPAGARDSFIADCSSSAQQSVDAKTAKDHCECGADKLNAELSTAEIKELMTNPNASQALKTKAVTAISSCKVVKKK
ncbi:MULTISPECIES: hypothetical protein [Pseudomonas]|uniref:Secreted protein n=2 Tax=Pseudomonas TaxID=286 RepID=A0A3M4QGV9_9PSED|nr:MULTISPECIES: hypothetical protein [Pseudomonas]MCF5548663.1 hypothetical protein [Pseudomonas salomonii]RAH01808.1 hypothetical protein DJ480_15185 [Pseudomonas sp. Leaf98]RMQ89688.1 hypothetical protein ALP97_02126 [Pseudomonas salomonii]